MRRFLRTALCCAAIAAALRAAPVATGAGEDDPVQAFAAGDFDGDGVPDAAAGLPEQNDGRLKAAGEVRVYSGKTGALLWRRLGQEEEEGRGEGLAAVGDVDGDGATDLAVSSPWCEPPMRVDVLSGKTGSLVRSIHNYRDLGFGEELCPLGDGSGRTRVDVVVRAGVGKKWFCARTDNGKLGDSLKDPSGLASMTFSVGNVDGDVTPDVAIGAFSEDIDGKKGAGRLRVLSGSRLRDSNVMIDVFTLKGTRAWERLGVHAAAAGDWNGDGKGDLLVGTPGEEKAKTGWRVRVLAGTDGAEIWRTDGQAGDLSIGGAAVVGDADGDGKPDVAVATPGRRGKSGAVSLVAAKDGSILWTLEGATGERLGEELLLAGDGDGDGVRELLVVAPGSSVKGKKGNGYLRLVSGKTGAVVTLFNPLAVK